MDIGICLYFGNCILVIAKLMQQFTVPQLIETEDKIMGPVTARQFIIMMFCFTWIGIFYKLFYFSLFITSSVIWFTLWVIIAFIKVNGRPFHFFILNFIQTLKRPWLRIWQQTAALEEGTFEEAIKEKEYIPQQARPLTGSRLTELSLIVDTAGTYKEINNEESQNKEL